MGETISPTRSLSEFSKYMKKYSLVVLFFLSIIVSVYIYVPYLQAGQSKVLADIDGKAITQKDFEAYLALFKGDARYTPKTFEGKKRMLKHLIDRTILLEAAKKEGYEKLDVLKKHPTMNQVEEETIILRAYLQDHVSKKVSVTTEGVSAYMKKHPNVSSKKAKEALLTEKQKRRFAILMKRLKKGHTVQIYPENIK